MLNVWEKGLKATHLLRQILCFVNMDHWAMKEFHLSVEAANENSREMLLQIQFVFIAFS